MFAFNPQDFKEDKLSILDIKAIDAAGTIYDIEMQLTIFEGLTKRIVFYGCVDLGAASGLGEQLAGEAPQPDAFCVNWPASGAGWPWAVARPGIPQIRMDTLDHGMAQQPPEVQRQAHRPTANGANRAEFCPPSDVCMCSTRKSKKTCFPRVFPMSFESDTCPVDILTPAISGGK